jgi:hypothetical protein
MGIDADAFAIEAACAAGAASPDQNYEILHYGTHDQNSSPNVAELGPRRRAYLPAAGLTPAA